MELLFLLVINITITAVLLGFSGFFIHLFDALVLTPKRIRSNLGLIQEIRDIPSSSSFSGGFQVSKKTPNKSKQVQRICFHLGKYRFCEGTIRISPHIGRLEENLGVPGRS